MKKVIKDGIVFECRDELDYLRLKKAGYTDFVETPVEEKTPTKENAEAVEKVNAKKGGK